MAKIDQEFRDLCLAIKNNGREYENKNRGVKRLQIPSYTFRHLFKDGFPAITNKKLPFKFIKGELIWFLRGDTDVTYLNQNGIDIWNKDAYNWYVKKYSNNDPIEGQEEFYHLNEDGTYRMFTLEEFSAKGVGSVGQNYSAQWRNFNGNTDQIENLINEMKSDIMSSRLKVNAWNPSELNDTALPPCHSEFQVIGVPLTLEERVLNHNTQAFYEGFGAIYPEHWDSNDALAKGRSIEQYLTDSGYAEFGFELHWNQRSVDTFLGLPFNIASYALLAKILEQATGYPAIGIEGTLKCVHFYDNQYEAVEELLSRDTDTHSNCRLEINFDFKSMLQEHGTSEMFNKLEISDMKLIGYTSDEEIKVEMLAPKEL